MKNRMWYLFALILLSGCAAHMVEKRGDSIQLLDKPQAKGGVVKYLNTGLSSWRRARRADAEKQMQRYCGGPYTILAEGPRSQFGAAMPIGKSLSFETDEYTYVNFECSKR